MCLSSVNRVSRRLAWVSVNRLTPVSKVCSVDPVTRLARGFPLDAAALVELAGSQGHDARRPDS